MLHTEWSLVFFTTIAQWATGIMIAVLPFVFAKKFNGYTHDRTGYTRKDRIGNAQEQNGYAQDLNLYTKLNHTALYVAAGLMVVALALSFLHLNNPLHSVYALSNLETSWLSREILFVSLFLFALALVSFILYFKKPGVKYYRTFIPGAAVIGLIMVYTMSRLYMIPTVPPWNSLSTLVGFYSTALLMGSAFVLGLSLHRFRAGTNRLGRNRLKTNRQATNHEATNYEGRNHEGRNHEGTKTNNHIHPGSKFGVLAFMAFLAVAVILVNGLFFNPATPEANVAFKPEPVHYSFILARWGTLLLGALSVFYLTWKKNKLQHMHFAFYLPFAFFLISELIARAVFYASYYRIGV